MTEPADPTAPAPAAGESPPPGGARGRAEAALAAYLLDAGVEHELGTRPGEWVVTLPGERKLKCVTSIVVRDEATSVSAFVIRNPDENHLEVYRYLLRHNLRLPWLSYCIDSDGDVFVRGQVPTSAVDEQLVDQLLGVVLEAADGPFNELLVLGFITSMRREWAWRVERGESLANLEAFRPLLEDPAGE